MTKKDKRTEGESEKRTNINNRIKSKKLIE